MNTRDPSFETSGQVKASYERFNHANIAGYITTGLTDTLAIDVTGFYDRDDGFIRDVSTGALRGKNHRWTGRGKLLFKPSDKVQFLLAYSHSEVDNPNYAAFGVYQNQTFANVIPGAVYGNSRGKVGSDQPNSFTSRTDVLTLTSEFDTGFADLKSYTLFSDELSETQLDLDSSNIPIFAVTFPIGQRTFSQELILTSKPGARLAYTIGANYFNNSNPFKSFNISIAGAPLFKAYDTKVDTDAFGAFVDLTGEAVDGLFLTGGARYSLEDQHGSFNIAVPIAPGVPLGSGPIDVTGTI